MKKKALFLYAITAACLTAGLLFPAGLKSAAHAADRISVYFFWGEGCPHCRDEKIFLEKMVLKYPMLEIRSLEVKNNRENAVLFSTMTDARGIKVKGVPTIFIGDLEPVVGYNGDDITGRQIELNIKYCIEHACADPTAQTGSPQALLVVPGNVAPGGQEGICAQDVECPDEGTGNAGSVTVDKPSEDLSRNIRVPLIGEVDIGQKALPLQTVVIAGMDSFNPCAFFVLFTLLGLLIHVQSRKRLLFIGGIFVFFSGLIYFLFMAAWLNIFLLAGHIAAFTLVAGIVAVLIAAINIKDFFLFRKGISLTISDSAKPKLFDRMRKLLKATSYPSVIMGTVVLAVAANTYELFCTAGFPMVYTRILTLNSLSKAQYYLYLVFYNIIYVIPLAVVVLFFAVTLGARKLTEREGQVLKLVSGMMMLGLGSVLLVKPELLNNISATAGLLVAALAASGIIIFISNRVGKADRFTV